MVVQLIGLAASVLCLFGAIQMWGLKKQGFLIYLAGAVLGIIGPIISAFTVASYVNQATAAMSELEGADAAIMGSAQDAAVAIATTAAWTAVAVSIVINLVFILMYNANKKHLVN